MTDQLLNEDIVHQIEEIFNDLKSPVAVLFFGQKENCDYCPDTLQLVQEVVGISDKISLSVYDLQENAGLAAQYKVDKAPGIVIAALEGEQILDYGIRFAGIPSGHEFSSFIHDLVLVSGRDSGLSQATRDFLSTLTQPVLLQVFVTPT